MVMGCTLATRLLGFVKIALVGAIFGASGVADVWNAVFTIPNNLRKLMAEGAMSSAFIPVLSASLLNDPGRQGAKKTTRAIMSFQLVLLVPLIGLGILFAEPVIHALLSFPQPEKMRLSAELFRWIFGYLLLISVSAVLMGVLNSHNVFVIPALTPLLFSIAVIAATLIFWRSLGIFSLAVGILAGGAAQILFQLPTFFKLGYDLRLDFDYRHEQFKRVLKLWIPVLVSSSIFAINQQIAVLFASGLEDGSTSALSNAVVFWQLPFGIFSSSIITVLFPRMSRQAAGEDRGGLRESVSYGLQFILILMIPASIVYVLMGRQIIQVALERSAFTAQGTLMAASVLTGYSLGMFSVAAFTFLQRFFYSRQDYRTPLAASLIVSALDIGFSLWLKETPLRVTGLAVANSLAFSAGTVILLKKARAILGSLNGRMMLDTLLRMAVSNLPLVVFLPLFLQWTAPFWTRGSSLRNLLLLLAALAGGGGITLLLYYLTGIRMVRDVLPGRLAKR